MRASVIAVCVVMGCVGMSAASAYDVRQHFIAGRRMATTSIGDEASGQLWLGCSAAVSSPMIWHVRVVSAGSQITGKRKSVALIGFIGANIRGVIELPADVTVEGTVGRAELPGEIGARFVVVVMAPESAAMDAIIVSHEKVAIDADAARLRQSITKMSKWCVTD